MAAAAVFLSLSSRIYGTKSAQNPGKHGPGPFAVAFFFSKILAKYFLRYRDFGDFLVLDYNEPFGWAPRIIFCVIILNIYIFLILLHFNKFLFIFLFCFCSIIKLQIW